MILESAPPKKIPHIAGLAVNADSKVNVGIRQECAPASEAGLPAGLPNSRDCHIRTFLSADRGMIVKPERRRSENMKTFEVQFRYTDRNEKTRSEDTRLNSSH